ncbi:hypothetical protein F5Y17DRAFT_454524 [Xylariaceae sp. FL0594]|nr:hypothetical protein F5Y17DRAFT_454524 [Xylariaceae sp. FL0594]
MAGRYERVNTQDDDPDTPTTPSALHPQRIPNSPPPSFHSRASSPERRRQDLNSDLADAFDTDGESSDDEPDDRQRLVRAHSFPVSQSTPASTTASADGQSGLPGASQQAIQGHPGAGASSGGSAPRSSRIYGGGIQSDGVFSNMTARPERGEKIVEEAPPTYEQAAADQAPPYWETTILAPGFGGLDEVYIDGMPVGSFSNFVWNGFISMWHPIIFLLTYLLHSTHASKNGALSGLGIQLIQWGFTLKSPSEDGMGDGSDGYAQPTDPNSHNFDPEAVSTGGGEGSGWNDVASGEYVAYILMIIGWFILIRAISDYIKARRHEMLVLQSPDRGLGVPIIAEGERAETVV